MKKFNCIFLVFLALFLIGCDLQKDFESDENSRREAKTYIINSKDAKQTTHNVDTQNNLLLSSEYTDDFENKIIKKYGYDSNDALRTISRQSENTIYNSNITLTESHSIVRSRGLEQMRRTVISDDPFINFEDKFEMKQGKIIKINRKYSELNIELIRE